MGKSKCAKSPISYLTTAPPEFETFKLLLMAVALPYCKMFHESDKIVKILKLRKFENDHFVGEMQKRCFKKHCVFI